MGVRQMTNPKNYKIWQIFNFYLSKYSNVSQKQVLYNTADIMEYPTVHFKYTEI